MADKRLGIIGAGTMGKAIAQVAAQSGYNVKITDSNSSQVANVLPFLEGGMRARVERGRMAKEEMDGIMSALTERIKGVPSLDAMGDCDIIVESVYEELPVKANVFKTLDSVCPPNTVFATNTSTIPITAIAASTKRPEKVIGMHFFNPVQAMRLVEIIRGYLTDEETVQAARDLSTGMGKTPVVVKDGAGFVANRILAPMINEAAFILMEGLGSREDIDTVMKLGANHPMGPLELADLIGLDICLHEIETMYEYTGDSKYRPCPLMKQMVAAGLLGRKTGRGFYEY